MPDTDRSQFPAPYTPAELETIAKAAGVEKCGPVALEKLQRAAEAFQWGRSADHWSGLVDEKDESLSFSATNKGRRAQINDILKLCAQGASTEEIETALNKLDAIGSQLLGPVAADDPRRLQKAARRALTKIPRSGPDPKRARRQFIDDLKRIFAYATGRRPGRRVHDGEEGPFTAFVKAALEPFKATQGCEADIKAVLHQSKRASGKRKNAAAARR
jgi:hypothetical protein